MHEHAESIATGRCIDGFVVGARLHQGGMADLWSVRHDAHPGPLLMKVPRVRDGSDATPIVGFEAEQMIMPLLSGLHVPRFVARGPRADRPYLVMDHVPGPSLRPRLDAAPLPLAELVQIGRQVAAALGDLHGQRVLHLDIKPSNILMRADGAAVLIDYGLSRHLDRPDLIGEQFMLPVGTGAYLSPEQVQFRRDDPRSDFFALGVMLYHLWTGKRPFGQPSTLAGLRKRLHDEPVPPRAHRADTPPWLQEVLLRCLEVDADQRFQTAGDLADAFGTPADVPLTDRARRLQARRRTGEPRARPGVPKPGAAPHPPATGLAAAARPVIVMAAVDIDAGAEALLLRLREAVRRIVQAEPACRLACVCVRRAGRIAMDDPLDALGRSNHLLRLARLKDWAAPIAAALGLDDSRLSFHVLEAPEAAQALLDFARRTGVDHLVMGARGQSALRRYLGSVSSAVVAQAPCTVTVVRAAELPA